MVESPMEQLAETFPQRNKGLHMKSFVRRSFLSTAAFTVKRSDGRIRHGVVSLLAALAFAVLALDMRVPLMAAPADVAPSGGKVLIAGGLTDGGYLSSTELYDPATNSFAAVADTAAMNAARIVATPTLLASGKGLIAGGGGFSRPSST